LVEVVKVLEVVEVVEKLATPAIRGWALRWMANGPGKRHGMTTASLAFTWRRRHRTTRRPALGAT